jgi:hypothetical protein
MPFDTTPTPPFPDVPTAPGVPPMARAAQVVFSAELLAADVATVIQAFGPPEWGIFTEDGSPVLSPDSIVAFDYRKEFRVSDYPVERGGFQTYDKIEMPGDVRVRMAVGGISAQGPLGNPFAEFSGAATRGPFLNELDAMAASLDLFTVVTPDVNYPSMNIVHYDYRREARSGASLLTVDVWLVEVRVTAQTQFSSTQTQTPEGAPNQAGGAVQGAAPTPAQTQAVTTPPVEVIN